MGVPETIPVPQGLKRPCCASQEIVVPGEECDDIRVGALLPVPEEILRWLDEIPPSSDPLDVSMMVLRVIVRLKERGDEEKIEGTIRALAPLEFWTGKPKEAPWNSYFLPQRKAENGREEYPCLAKLNSDDVEEWARLADVLKRAAVRARFADAIWELGKLLGSPRNDLHRYGQLAAELYLEAAGGATATAQNSLLFLEILVRSISLGIQFRRPELIERGFRRMLGFAAAAEQAHLGLWTAPFDRLIGLKGLTDSQRQEILEHHEKRLNASIAASDWYQIMMAGGALAKYFHDHKNYTREKEITLACGEAVLEIAAGMDATHATHHIGNVLQWYRQVGLRKDAERVRVLLEKTAKGVIGEMKRRRLAVPIDRERIERKIAERLNVLQPLVALYRVAEWCVPSPQTLKKLLDEGGFIAHRIMPTEIIGQMGLPVGIVSTDEDEDGHIVMRMAEQMNFTAMLFLSGIEDWKKKFELGSLPDAPNFFDCPLIPADRVSLYREGMAAFDAEDYVKCIHVLVPQVENSLRELLRILGGSETKTDDEGAFQLKNMNDVLHEPQVRDALDEKLWSFLKVLYADKRGINLRNIVAHGIAPVEAFNCVNAGLVIQSIVLLSMIRPEALHIPEDEAPERTPENLG